MKSASLNLLVDYQEKYIMRMSHYIKWKIPMDNNKNYNDAINNNNNSVDNNVNNDNNNNNNDSNNNISNNNSDNCSNYYY